MFILSRLQRIALCALFCASAASAAATPAGTLPATSAAKIGADDVFGHAVAISVDTAVVAAPYEDIGGRPDAGAVYIYLRTVDGWSRQQIITLPDARRLGLSIALDNDRLAIGEPAMARTHIYERDDGVWEKITTITGTGEFGTAVALSGRTLVIGAPSTAAWPSGCPGSGGPGFAFVYERSGDGVWLARQTLAAVDGSNGDCFGDNVAIDGAMIAVAAMREGRDNHGAVYPFERVAGVWQRTFPVAKIAPSTGRFAGNGLALDAVSRTVLVGIAGGVDDNPGHVRVYVEDGTFGWIERAVLRPTRRDGEHDGTFGYRIGLSKIPGSADFLALIGAPTEHIGAAEYQGAAYLFRGQVADWTLQQRLDDADGTAGDSFGSAVGIDADHGVAIVGVDRADVDFEDQGDAVLYLQAGDQWNVDQRVAGDTPPLTQGPRIDPVADTAITEDTLAAIPFRVFDPDTDTKLLQITAHSSDDDVLRDSDLAVVPGSGEHLLHIDPPADVFGSTTITLTVSDGNAAVSTEFDFDILPVNDAPRLEIGSDRFHAAGTAGAQVVPGFVRLFDPGPENESAQRPLEYRVAAGTKSGNPVESVAIDLDGTLRYTLTGSSGIVDFDVAARDDGGTANSGNDTSSSRSVRIRVAEPLPQITDFYVQVGNGRASVRRGEQVAYRVDVGNGLSRKFGVAAADGENASLQITASPALRIDAWICAPEAACPPPGTGSGPIDTALHLPVNSEIEYDVLATVLEDGIGPARLRAQVAQRPGIGKPELTLENNVAEDIDAVLGGDVLLSDGFERAR